MSVRAAAMNAARLPDGRAYVVRGFNLSAFCEVLAEVMASRKITWTLLARETGVRRAALSRMAQGALPDAPTIAVLSAWANLNPADFLVMGKSWRSPYSLAEISTVLESDPSLTPAAAQDLETIIYLAYTSFRQQRA